MKFQILLSLLFALGISGTAMARQSAPPVLQYQARLLDTLGNPVTASGVVVTFRVYDAPVGGNELFAETQSIDVVGGLLSAPIGSVQPLATTLFSTSANRWLGITVGADTEMTPRQRFGSSAYALRADTARLADDVTGMEIHPASVSIGGVLVIDENGNWVGSPTGLVGPMGDVGPTGASPFDLDAGNAVFLTGKIGIGTSTPNGKLTVSTSATGTGLEHTNGTTTMASKFSAGGFGRFGTTSDHTFQVSTNDNPRITVLSTGEVGFGLEHSRGQTTR